MPTTSPVPAMNRPSDRVSSQGDEAEQYALQAAENGSCRHSYSSLQCIVPRRVRFAEAAVLCVNLSRFGSPHEWHAPAIAAPV
jgi:hypothetical protein